MSIYAIIVCIGLFVILIIGIIGLVLLLTKDDRADIKRRSDLDEFAHWIAKQIFFKEVKDDLFVELTCRKLHELGIVEKRNDEWFYTTADDTDLSILYNRN